MPASVLVVDDESMMRELFKTFLSDSYDVRTADGGESAIEALAAPVDLVVLDRRMPTVTGDEVAHHILRWQDVETAEATITVEEDGRVVADVSRLQQMLENLFRNAVEHGGPSVGVTVGAIEGGFYVADDGSGIPVEKREEVFEAGVSTAAEGTGFGLSIVKEVVEAHGWEIRVVESRDGGARFEVTGVESPES